MGIGTHASPLIFGRKDIILKQTILLSVLFSLLIILNIYNRFSPTKLYFFIFTDEEKAVTI